MITNHKWALKAQKLNKPIYRVGLKVATFHEEESAKRFARRNRGVMLWRK